MMKQCRDCGEAKPATPEFFRDPARRRLCKACYNKSRPKGVPESQVVARTITRRVGIALSNFWDGGEALLLMNETRLSLSVGRAGQPLRYGWRVVAFLLPNGVRAPIYTLTENEGRALRAAGLWVKKNASKFQPSKNVVVNTATVVK